MQPIRLNASHDAAVRWRYMDSLIEIIYLYNSFAIRCRPEGLSMETVLWPIQCYEDTNRAAWELNKLLPKVCSAIKEKKYLTPRCNPYLGDQEFLSYLKSLTGSFCITVQSCELSAVIEKSLERITYL